ncbi:hypothetical protein [Defluviimonas sp. WL0075]|uniref:hypothetical protein n=1 Tax=Albidovulum sediminicola TaxID=2984331 RepID=UPI0021E78B67|nr:hypothetical protein [Defluviimonas sp. WL0075]
MQHLPDALVSIRDFAPPRTRATNRVRDAYLRLRKKLHIEGNQGDSALVPEDLERIRDPILGPETFERLESHVFDLLDKTFAAWIDEEETPHRFCACLHQESAPDDLFARWAAARGHDILADGKPDGRRRFAVLPSLDPLCARDPEGLKRLRQFCDKIEGQKTKLLFCGSAVQWGFLRRVSPLGLQVTDVRVIPPFDGRALADLLGIENASRQFRSRSSGADILKIKGNELEDDYLIDLAAGVRGCPWAALQMVNRSVSSQQDADDAGATWLARYDWPGLPPQHARVSRFLLHAVLIHGELAPQDLGSALPIPVPPGLVRALAGLGYLQLAEDGAVRIVPCMAAHIRRVLSEAGFPLGEV